MSWSDSERDTRIRALYFVVGAFILLSIFSLFFGLLAYNLTDATHDTDAIAISLTTIEVVLALFAIMLGIVAAFGFWAIRGAAVTAAKQEARLYLDEKAREMFEEASKTRQHQEKDEPNLPDTLDTDAIIESATEEGKDDGNQ